MSTGHTFNVFYVLLGSNCRLLVRLSNQLLNSLVSQVTIWIYELSLI